MGNFINLIGMKFGRLKVLNREYKEDKHKRVYWRCLCDCGKEKIVDSSSLTSKNTTSCGCFQKENIAKLKFVDISNKRFSRLVAIKYLENKKWLCKCDCGKEKVISGNSLRMGKTRSCGCLHRDTMRKKTIPNSGSSLNKLFGMYKNKSKKRGHEFLLTKEEFVAFTKGNCFYCGIKPLQEAKCKNVSNPYIYNGIDRIDSLKNYTVDNCVSCCKKCNYAKQRMSIDDFKEWIKIVYNNFFNRENSNGS